MNKLSKSDLEINSNPIFNIACLAAYFLTISLMFWLGYDLAYKATFLIFGK